MDAGAPPGPRVLHVDSPRGTSNRFPFRVTRWTSIREAEPNDQQKTAHAVPLPAVIEGRVARLTDTDFFRFHAGASERLAFDVMTARSKASGFVTVALLSSAGEELAHNNARLGPDPYFEHTFDADGDNLVAVTARRFADFFTVVKDDQVINWQYQLAIGRSPMLWSLFPAGGKRGTRVDAELRADFVPDTAQPLITGHGVRIAMGPIPDGCRCRHRLSIDIAPDAPLGTRYLSVPDESGNTLYLGFVIGGEPELVDDAAKPQHVDLPVTINGRVAAAEQDRYRIKVNHSHEFLYNH
jgi:hypothetical protein